MYTDVWRTNWHFAISLHIRSSYLQRPGNWRWLWGPVWDTIRHGYIQTCDVQYMYIITSEDSKINWKIYEIVRNSPLIFGNLNDLWSALAFVFVKKLTSHKNISGFSQRVWHILNATKLYWLLKRSQIIGPASRPPPLKIKPMVEEGRYPTKEYKV